MSRTKTEFGSDMRHVLYNTEIAEEIFSKFGFFCCQRQIKAEWLVTSFKVFVTVCLDFAVTV